MIQARERYNGIELLRAALFVGIVAFHSGVRGSQILWGGIEVFFVISAFFLTKKLTKTTANELKVLSTARHRLARLTPVYYFLLIAAFVWFAVSKNIFAFKDLLIHGIFSQNINWMFTDYKSELIDWTAHTWTLSIEMYLFVLWLIAFKLLKSKRARTVFCVIAIAVAFGWRISTTVVWGDAIITSVCPLAHMDAFALGSLLAMYDDSKLFRNRAFSGILLSLSGIVFVIACICVTSGNSGVDFIGGYKLYNSSDNYLNHPFTCNVYFGFQLLTAGLISIFRLVRADGPFWKPFVKIGNVSYTAYLLHYPINMELKSYIVSRPMVFVITVIASVALALLVEWLISLVRAAFKKRKRLKGEVNDTSV